MSTLTAVIDYYAGQKEALDEYYKVWEPFWQEANDGEPDGSVQDVLLPII